MVDKAKKTKNPVKTLARTLGFVARSYPFHCIAVLVCLVVTTVVTANGTLFVKQLIEQYIQPMLDGDLSQDTGFKQLAVNRAYVRRGRVLDVSVEQTYGHGDAGNAQKGKRHAV